MGADEARALQVADRLTAAAERFLGAPIELRGFQKQMVPVNLQTLGGAPWGAGPGGAAGNDPAAVWPAVWSFIEEHTDGEKAWHEAGEEASADEAGALDLDDAQRLDDDAGFDAERMVTAAEAEALHGPAGDAEATDDDVFVVETSELPPESPPESLEPEPAKPAKRRAETTVADLMARTRRRLTEAEPGSDEPAEAPEGAEPDLSLYLTGGGVALAARSPRHPQTQIVLDENGVIHLLRRHTAGDEDPAMSLRAAVLDLIETRAWVREHADLLAMTQRQCHFDLRAEPVLHLFTDEAKVGAALVGRLGEFVRLHLLKEVKIGRQSTWFSTELN
jgi:hypothetical protein